MTTPTKEIATESGHFYDAKTGEPRYEVPYADPKKGMRPTTLRDAKKHGWVPSVTQIIKEAAKPALETWKIKMAMLSALTLPRKDGEDDASFCDRILTDSQEQARKARERGTELHGAIEKAIQQRAIPPLSNPWCPHISQLHFQLAKIGVDLFAGDSERSFASPEGYGGKIDYVCDGVALVDFKNKINLEDGKNYAYDEHIEQLAAYRNGLGYSDKTRLINAFIGCEDAKVQLVEWDNEEAARALSMFRSLLTFWKSKSRI